MTAHLKPRGRQTHPSVLGDAGAARGFLASAIGQSMQISEVTGHSRAPVHSFHGPPRLKNYETVHVAREAALNIREKTINNFLV